MMNVVTMHLFLGSRYPASNRENPLIIFELQVRIMGNGT
jgi:hypothetical protein